MTHPHLAPVTNDALIVWCEQQLGSPPAAQLFQLGHLSTVIGLRLRDGRQVVIKIRPATPRIRACVAVQRRLWRRGYPCPQPLAGPARLGTEVATAEEFVPGGVQLQRSDAPPLFAEALARLVALAPAPSSLPSLRSTLPWVGWDHDGSALWPRPDDRDDDLNVHLDLPWLDLAGRRVRERLLRCHLPLVTGHADWESQNLRWCGRRLHVVHDWDSVVAQPEAAIAGAASAVFTSTGAPLTEPTVEESAEFLDAFAAMRGHAWSPDEREVAWAAGLWVRTFNAKKAALDGPDAPEIRRLQEEVDERLRRAGVGLGESGSLSTA